MSEVFSAEIFWIGTGFALFVILLVTSKYRPKIVGTRVPAPGILHGAWGTLKQRGRRTLGVVFLVAVVSVSLEEIQQIIARATFYAPPESLTSGRLALSMAGHAALDLGQTILAALVVWFVMFRAFPEAINSRPASRWWLLIPAYIAFQIVFYLSFIPHTYIFLAGYPLRAHIHRVDDVIQWPQFHDLIGWTPAILFGVSLVLTAALVAPAILVVIKAVFRRTDKLFTGFRSWWVCGIYLGATICTLWVVQALVQDIVSGLQMFMALNFSDLISVNTKAYDLIGNRLPIYLSRTALFMLAIAISAEFYRWMAERDLGAKTKTPPG